VYFSTLKKLHEIYRDSQKLDFEFTGYSIKELKTGKISSQGKEMRAGVARIVRMIPTYKLIYGEELLLKSLYKKKDLDLLKKFIKTFEEIFFPAYKDKKIGFQDLLKQTLWLFELEASVRDKLFTFTTWNNLVKQFENKHLIHEVVHLRKIKKVEKGVKSNFILKLKRYLKKLTKELA